MTSNSSPNATAPAALERGETQASRPFGVPRQRTRVLHLITTLGSGGAEMMLYKLAAAMDPARFETRIVSMTSGGLLVDRLERLGIPVHTLHMSLGSPNPLAIPRLVSILREFRPSVLQTWMYHADLLGTVAGRLARVPRIVWNIRASDLDFLGSHRTLLNVFRIHAVLSRFPDAAVVNSSSGLRFHEDRYHRPRRWALIPNGFDLTQFRFDADCRHKLRRQLDIADDSIAVGLIARFNRMKGHETFFRAARRMAEELPHSVFILAGRDVTDKNQEIATALNQLGLRGRVHLLGERSDIHSLLPALDIMTLCSSSGEGFPNVLGEAMCCEVPCVASNVGDSAVLLGDTGRIVKPRDAEALVSAWRDLVRLGEGGRRLLGVSARKRVESSFSLPIIARKYEQLYEELLTCVE